jgi:ABC-type lipoprotein release transport system permease subunit
MGSITFAVVIIAITRSMQYGTYDAVESYVVHLYNGELQLHRNGFQDEKTLTYSFEQTEEDWKVLLEKIPDFKASCQRITSFGLVSSDSSSAGTMIVGIEPEGESRVSEFTKMVKEGEGLEDGDDHQVILGKTLARNLQVEVGDVVVVLTQGYRSEMGADTYTIKGILRTGTPEIDRAIMILSLRDAQELFSMEGRITHIVVRTENFRKAKSYASLLASELDTQKFEILPWQELMPELLQLIFLDNVSGAIFLAFLVILVGFEIFNTTMMSIVERVREFGILQSLGMKPLQIRGLLLLELILKITIALGAGVLITFILVNIFVKNPIPLGDSLTELYEHFGWAVDKLYFSAETKIYIEPLISVLFVSIIALIYPIIKVTRLSPVEALRKT